MYAMAYNKSLLQRFGAPLPRQIMSWDELTQYCCTIKPLLPAGVYPMVDLGGNQVNLVSYYMGQKQAWIYKDERTYSTPEAFKGWLDLWVNFRREGLIPDAETTASFPETDVSNSILVAGRAVLGSIWSNQLGGYQAAMTDELDLILLPGAQDKGLTINPSRFLTVNKKSSNREAALRFVNFFVNNLEAGSVLGADRGTPSSQAVRDHIKPNATPTEQKIYDFYTIATQYTVAREKNLPYDNEFLDTFRLYYEQSAYNQITTTQAAQNIYDLVQRLIARSKQ
ncbi:MAG: ABC transporter substrate-binding protein [Treponema sp.]|jgi:multiple sugar transport system substrate-binding protein|nr:ABC transporter substrate-binding protein [Treponema sp.]